MQTINRTNFNQAATTISRYCADNAKGKAKAKTVAEAICQFLGYKDSNAAAAAGKTTSNASEAPEQAYILTYKGNPTLHLTIEGMAHDLVTELSEGQVRIDDLDFTFEQFEDQLHPRLVISDGNLYGRHEETHEYITIHSIEVAPSCKLSLSEQQSETLSGMGDFKPDAGGIRDVLAELLSEATR